ncbi:transposon tf2-6 polyprotein [Plakobranchus ocellatus]|uniref:Transposon tf2-6 polyprotein n=1 Tax=Plakobranchus ocellatus TaxID=259542 RepID=A0AAV3Y799_9GAST|nr:transposon tf2-6 polyprotein [Plakobranchus ocellatus]
MELMRWIHGYLEKASTMTSQVDAFSKYPCIHLMNSILAKATTRKLVQDFSHSGYPRAIETYDATCFSSAEFQTWCEQRGIQHPHGVPYHPETSTDI